MTDTVSTLPSQIVEVLRDQRMSFTQLSTYYSIKYRSSLNERIKGAKAANVQEYLKGFSNLFEVEGDTVKARPKNSQPGSTEKPAISSIRYAHISKGIQNILNETQSKSLEVGDLETTFETRFSVSLVSVIGMPTIEYLQRKANVFEIEGKVVRLQIAFQKETELKSNEVNAKGARDPLAEESTSEKISKESTSEKISKGRWSDLPVLPEEPSDVHPKPKGTEQKTTQPKQKASNPPVAVDGLLKSLGSPVPTASKSKDVAPVDQVEVQPKAESDGKKQETQEKKCENLPLFAVDELVRIFEEHSEGPIMHSSVLCSLFMQQLGASVTEISGKKPMELFRQHPESFIWLSSGNLALAKYRQHKAVQHELKLLDAQPKCVRVKAAAAEASLPVPDTVTEADVVNYMISLLQENEDRDSIYISALCGRFMQRFRKPVTEIVGCKPNDFIKKYKDVFYLEKGGHVKLVKNDESPAPRSNVTEGNSSAESVVVSAGTYSMQKEVAQQEFPTLSTAQPAAGEARHSQGTSVTVPPPVRPWRRGAAEAQKESSAVASVASQQREMQQQVDDFCTRLRKQLFFRVTEVLSEAPMQAPGSNRGRAAEIPVTVKVCNLPKEIEAEWLPQLIRGLQQVLEHKFHEEVDGVVLEGEGVHCCLRNLSISLFVRLAVV
jgi:hypothetical protein